MCTSPDVQNKIIEVSQVLIISQLFLWRGMIICYHYKKVVMGVAWRSIVSLSWKGDTNVVKSQIKTENIEMPIHSMLAASIKSFREGDV